MYKRYGNPGSLLKSLTLSESLDFFLYLFDQEDKELLQEIWLSKEIEMPLDEFIDKYSKKNYISPSEKKKQSAAEDELAIKRAEAILGLAIREEDQAIGTV